MSSAPTATNGAALHCVPADPWGAVPLPARDGRHGSAEDCPPDGYQHDGDEAARAAWCAGQYQQPYYSRHHHHHGYRTSPPATPAPGGRACRSPPARHYAPGPIPVTVVTTPTATYGGGRWSSPPTPSSSSPGTPPPTCEPDPVPDMALIIERLLDDLREKDMRVEREMERRVRAETARARAEERTTACVAMGPADRGGPSAPVPYGAYPSGASASGPARAETGPEGPPAPSRDATGPATVAAAAASPPSPPHALSTRTFLLALVPILIALALFAAWVIWRFAGVDRRIAAAMAAATAHAVPAPTMPAGAALPVVTPVAAPAAAATPSPPPPLAPTGPSVGVSSIPRGAGVVVDANNRYYIAHPMT